MSKFGMFGHLVSRVVVSESLLKGYLLTVESAPGVSIPVFQQTRITRCRYGTCSKSGGSNGSINGNPILIGRRALLSISLLPRILPRAINFGSLIVLTYDLPRLEVVI